MKALINVATLSLFSVHLIVGQSANFVETSSGNTQFIVEGGHGVSIADYDNDGDDDLFISSSPVKLFRNNGNFSFSDVTSSSGLSGNALTSVWFDSNNDGWLDLLMASSSTTKFYKNNGNGTFSGLDLLTAGITNETSTQALLAGDLNGDGWLDIYSNKFNKQNQVFFSQGEFLFEDATTFSETGITNLGMGGMLTDIDHDNDLDIYLVFDGSLNPNVLYLNNGDGTFLRGNQFGLDVKANGMGVDAADFNHDGKNDFYVTNLYDNSCLISQPDNTYLDKASANGTNDFGMSWGVVCLDYDNDTFSDIYMNNEFGYSSYSSKLYKNNAGSGFSVVSTGTNLENNSRGYGCGSADLDSDGKMDLVVVNFRTGGVKIFRNDESSVGNWVEVDLVGTTSNKFAVGARVEISADGVSQFDEVVAGSGYSTQNSMRLHFGLGSSQTVDELKIHWPDGSVETYNNVSGNQRYIAIQGESLSDFNVTSFQEALTRASQLGTPIDLPTTEVEIKESHSIARLWNEQLLQSIRKDFARPTVQARNLFHISMAMYDAWAVFDTNATTYFLGKPVGNYFCPFSGFTTTIDLETARNEALSYAAFRLIIYRYSASPNAGQTIAEARKLFAILGYDESFTSADYSTGSGAALGNYIAEKIIEFGLGDGSNESNKYANQYYQPINQPLFTELPGAQNVTDPNRWQPLTLSQSIDQNGNVISNTPPFLSPEWGNVIPFSLKESDKKSVSRDGHTYHLYHDPGMPPQLDKVSGGGQSNEYKWNFELVSAWSSHLDPADCVKIDISPATVGNIQSYPITLSEYNTFYDFENGGDKVTGHAINPRTNTPYAPQIVYRGDYTRVLAEFWADGPSSETPPGHWFTILNYVSDHPLFERKFAGSEVMEPLEWDVKSYFVLGGAMHDIAITAWGIKGYYDYVRPITAIRYLSSLGQSSDPSKAHFHLAGIELKPGLIELIEAGDPLAGSNNENVGKIKLYCWKGPSYITTPTTDQAGVDWILAENWFPYQRPTFVTPPFAGYISGHSTYSSGAAEVLTLLTGDEFFPGGLGEFEAPKNEYLVFEEGPSKSIKLQWARYKDASDQCSLSRIWGGIHPPADDIPGRHIGKVIGKEAFDLALDYFNGIVTGITKNDPIQFSFFPNPLNEKKVLYLTSSMNLIDAQVSFTDILGRPIMNLKIDQSMLDNGISLETINSGLYIANICGTGFSSAVRIIIR